MEISFTESDKKKYCSKMKFNLVYEATYKASFNLLNY